MENWGESLTTAPAPETAPAVAAAAVEAAAAAPAAAPVAAPVEAPAAAPAAAPTAAAPAARAPRAGGALAAALGGVKKQAAADGATADSAVDELTKKTEQLSTAAPVPAAASTPAAIPAAEGKAAAGEAEEATVTALSGLHPEDENAEIEIIRPKGVDTVYQAVQTFDDLPLSKELKDGVYAMKFTRPSKIQAQALPIILDQSRPNLIGQAHHGSGKTAAYALGMLSRVDPSIKKVQCLCVCPVRELVIQVFDVVTQLGQYTTIEAYKAIPGCPKEPVRAQIVIGTPGTILAKLRAREITKDNIVLFVADEADQMINKQGLGEQTMKIQKQLNRDCQILLFSATFSDKVARFASKVAKRGNQDPIKIIVKREDLSLDAIKQYFIECNSQQQKFQVLSDIYGLLNYGQSIIFVHTVATAKDLTNKMRGEGHAVSILHGQDMDVTERDKVMGDFRSGKTTVLITTNVLARGIDVLQVTLVVNYDVPLSRNNEPDPETYIHRIGRSGRFGRKGVAINLVHDDASKKQLNAIANYYQMHIYKLPADDLEKIETLVKGHLGEEAS